jgi:hypothetical protein
MMGTVFFRYLEKTTTKPGKTQGRDRREQLPDEASDKTGISKDPLFFQETVQPPEGF